MTIRELRRANAGRAFPEVPPEMAALLAAGKLEQVCPVCWTREAAGWHCTRCLRQMGPDDWRRGERSEAQKAASSVLGRSKAETGSYAQGNGAPAAVEGGS